MFTTLNIEWWRIFKAAAQLVGVCGREYRVYFYSTYINQSKNKKQSVTNGKSSIFSLKQTVSTEQVVTKTESNSLSPKTEKRKIESQTSVMILEEEIGKQDSDRENLKKLKKE